jgi:hypothetical protein
MEFLWLQRNKIQNLCKVVKIRIIEDIFAFVKNKIIEIFFLQIDISIINT